ncbi:MAG: hypothetical protein ACI4HQ_07045 [Acetatifactor sp.]
MKHSKSSMFLMELIIAILFFSLASAVCIQLFAKSHIISNETVNQNYAISQAQNLAEIWYAAEGDLNQASLLLQEGSVSEDGSSLILTFDEDWNPLKPNNDTGQPTYFAKLINTGNPAEENMLKARIYVYYHDENKSPVSDTMLYTLELIQHIGKRRGQS